MNSQEKEKLYQSLVKNIVDNLSFDEEFDLTGTNLTPEIVMKSLEDLGHYLVYYEIDAGDFECWFGYQDSKKTYGLHFLVDGMTFKFKMSKDEVEE